MNYEDFIRGREGYEMDEQLDEATVEESSEASSEALSEELQQEIETLRKENETLRNGKAELEKKYDEYRTEREALMYEIASLKIKVNEMKTQLGDIGGLLARNTEMPISNQVSLIDRNTELADRFEGETRDHVIEVLKEARDNCEKDGRLRRAQILESVLLANESNGQLAKRRQDLEKIFADNQNIINGQVINELDKLNISYKSGENYLLAKEIIKRTY